MSLVYRSMVANNKVAEVLVEGPDDIVCVLTDKNLKTEDKIHCCSIRQAERLIDNFLRIPNLY